MSVGADTCRKAKPDKGIFLYALQELGARAEETLFIGDDIEKDYRGATGAGLRALLIDRDTSCPQSHDTIRSLVEVLDHI